MVLWLVPLFPFLGAILSPLLIRSGRDICANGAALTTLAALGLLLSRAGTVIGGGTEHFSLPWIQQIGLSFSFRLDGLSLFFASLILVIGLLVIIYARFYLSRQDPIGRFYAWLLLFQGAMLGVALADNLILMLIFWELTSLTSFLLIGYWHKKPEAREGARMAMMVTGGGGLALIAGLMLLGQAAGTYEISQILERGDWVRGSPLYAPALILILLGAFTKSAQFPFHFWLPNAMAAPSPVSAYLHSATMVKAGIFLLARLWPVLAGTDLWFAIVAPVGLVTMLIGAGFAVFKYDLKALLAFSTISHLGLIVMLLGIATPMAVVAAMFHMLNHALFKAALFMSAGIVDHETGTRDLRKLGGLARLMPITATISLVAAAAMAGVPLLNGFLSKEMMLEEAAHTVYAGMEWLFPVAATLAALISVGYSARLAISTFLGPRRANYPKKPHDPPAGMWLSVAVLIVPIIAIGVLPETVAGRLVAQVSQSVLGGTPLPDYHLALWHGFTPALFMSLIAFAGGAGLFVLLPRLRRAARTDAPAPDSLVLFDKGVAFCVRISRRVTEALHSGALSRYLRIILLLLIVMGLYALLSLTNLMGARVLQPVNAPAVVAWFVLVCVSVAVTLYHHERLMALLLTSVVGVVVALTFIQFSAPDLALTQITVDAVTTILMLLALNFLPKYVPTGESRARRIRDAILAGCAGLGVALLAFAVMTRDGATAVSDYYLAHAKPGGGGANVVNVILVDFRGFDTFAEIIVLSIAAIAIFAILDINLRGTALRRMRSLRPKEEAGDAHPLMLVIAGQILLPVSLALGVYIFLRGHNAPGGGFVAGLIVAIALIMQYIVSGYNWSSERLRLEPQALIGAGVTIAGVAGMAPWVYDKPFLSGAFTYLNWPIVGKFELATAIVFDLGVFLTVIGVVVSSLSRLSRIAQRIDPSPESERRMDIALEGDNGDTSDTKRAGEN